MKIRKIVVRILHLFRKNTLAAKILGVSFGKDCKFIGDPISTFGSEPWAISIGDHVEITNGVQIITHDGALWVLRGKEEYKNSDIIQKVIIGNNVFIGVNSVILGGVNIGDNVIIGAGSIVNKSIPSNSLAAGVPVKVIKTIDAYEDKVKKTNIAETKGMNYKQKRKIWENN